ncbi:MAG: hypothetical protein QM500_14430 [Methylococcales bacterium]
MKQNQKPLSFSLHPDNHAYIEAVVLKQKETNHRYSRSMYMDDLITHLRTKAKPVKKDKTELSEQVYPFGLNVKAWDKWIDFRKKAKFAKYKTDSTMVKLSKMGSDAEQILIVQNSIDMQYQGLFALKQSNSAQSKTADNLSACEDFINE